MSVFRSFPHILFHLSVYFFLCKIQIHDLIFSICLFHHEINPFPLIGIYIFFNLPSMNLPFHEHHFISIFVLNNYSILVSSLNVSFSVSWKKLSVELFSKRVECISNLPVKKSHRFWWGMYMCSEIEKIFDSVKPTKLCTKCLDILIDWTKNELDAFFHRLNFLASEFCLNSTQKWLWVPEFCCFIL